MISKYRGTIHKIPVAVSIFPEELKSPFRGKNLPSFTVGTSLFSHIILKSMVNPLDSEVPPEE